MIPQRKSAAALYLLFLLSALLFVLFMISSMIRPYGYFCDELYFIACSKRLAFGYIDQPPLSILLLSAVQNLLGHTLFAVRILPALSISSTVFVTGLLARRLGAGMGGMLLSGLAVMAMPVFLLFGSFYSMNAYEPLIWTTITYFVTRMIMEQDPRYWLHAGILTGVGLEMKHTMVLYAFALLAGFLCSGQRRLLFSRWLLWGALACFLIVLPNLVWQIVNHFPSLELYKNSFSSKNIGKSYGQVYIEQVIFVNPFTWLLWTSGLVSLFFSRGRPFRPMLVAYFILLIMMMAGHSSRPDRIAAIYPFLMASGAVAMEQYLRPASRRAAQISTGLLILAGGIMAAPVSCPLFSPAATKQYISRLGLHFDLEAGKMGEPLPQWLADRIGWRELTAEVARVYRSLPEKERQNCVIISTNYGEAGALELYGPEFGLPAVYATHNSFHSWGPPSDTVKTYIAVCIDEDDARKRFTSLEQVAEFHCPDCTRPQRVIPLFVLRGPTFSISREWANFKVYQ
ncbi:MAG: glycosyltransferase family 39 protein [Bacteroidota bacterium]